MCTLHTAMCTHSNAPVINLNESLTAGMAAERRRNQEQSHIISKTEKEIEKLKHIVKGSKDELSKVQVLMDEASIREEALKAQVTSFQKENSALKEKKKNLLREARDWEDRHRELSEKIKVLQRAQKELEDTLEHKENEIEVLSDCITELRQLEACDGAELLKGGALSLANGEAAEKKGDALKTRIKQMLDVSRVKTTLSIVEEERNRYLEKLLAEEKQRHDLEEQIQKLEHDRASLQGEKSQLEGQFHTIQQKLEIMNDRTFYDAICYENFSFSLLLQHFSQLLLTAIFLLLLPCFSQMLQEMIHRKWSDEFCSSRMRLSFGVMGVSRFMTRSREASMTHSLI